MGERKNRKFPRVLRRPSYALVAVLICASSIAGFTQGSESIPELDDLDQLLVRGDERFWQQLQGSIATRTSLADVRRILIRYVEHPAGRPYVGELSRWIVHLYELEGEYKAGYDFLLGLGEDTLLEGVSPLAIDLSRLELELGLFAEAHSRLRTVAGRSLSDESRRQAVMLGCRAALLQEDSESLRVCSAELEEIGLGDMALALSLQQAQNRGEVEQVEALSSELRRQYPLVADSLIGGSQRISRFPGPLLLLHGGSVPPGDNRPNVRSGEPSSPTATPVASQPSTPQVPVGVQVGSFRDQENASYMAEDVGRLGFEVSIRSSDRSGTIYHQVIVAPVNESPQQTVVRLKEHGLEGFLLFD